MNSSYTEMEPLGGKVPLTLTFTYPGTDPEWVSSSCYSADGINIFIYDDSGMLKDRISYGRKIREGQQLRLELPEGLYDIVVRSVSAPSGYRYAGHCDTHRHHLTIPGNHLTSRHSSFSFYGYIYSLDLGRTDHMDITLELYRYDNGMRLARSVP